MTEDVKSPEAATSKPSAVRNPDPQELEVTTVRFAGDSGDGM
ncbi:MAG: hypothetical protein ACE5GA_04695 [Candidatus Zixiibacteriota bacterium]